MIRNVTEIIYAHKIEVFSQYCSKFNYRKL